MYANAPESILENCSSHVQAHRSVSFAVQKEGTKPKDLHHDLVPFLANNTTLFVKVRIRLL